VRGGTFIGTPRLGDATSLPKLFTTLNSIKQGVPELAAGDIFEIVGQSRTDLFSFRGRFIGHRPPRADVDKPGWTVAHQPGIGG
jgi:hypothetical protein